MNSNNKKNCKRAEVHPKSLRQPLAKTTLVPPELIPAELLGWPEFFDTDFIAILTEADELLKCIVEPLESNIINQTRNKDIDSQTISTNYTHPKRYHF